jgi:hypothetical protein
MDPDTFIADWIEKNPKGCQTLAGAVLYSYFNDASNDTDERVLTLRKAPDAEDLNNELIDAIRSTDVVHRIQAAIGGNTDHYW